MTQPINVNRYQNKVRAMLGIRGENPIPDIEKLQLVLVVESDRSEWSWPGGEGLGGNGFNQTAIAAQRSFVAFVNPVGSGLIATIEDILADQPSDILVASEAAIFAQAGLVSTVGLIRDTRHILLPGGFTVSGIRFMQGTNAAPAGAGFGPLNRIPVVNQRYSKEIVVGAGTGVSVACVAVNTALLAHFTWRERAQERGILS
jgi:hypothetical protein